MVRVGGDRQTLKFSLEKFGAGLYLLGESGVEVNSCSVINGIVSSILTPHDVNFLCFLGTYFLSSSIVSATTLPYRTFGTVFVSRTFDPSPPIEIKYSPVL